MEKEIIDKSFKAIVKNKYLITGVVFFIWIALFDASSWYDRIRLKREYIKLENEKNFYLEKIKRDSISYQELKTNNENLEKFARENYLMKKDNEDIFIIVEEDKKAKK
ncbi:MAG: septum formation inhibitor [Bacteroidales bacterium]